LGVRVFQGHAAANVGDAELLVMTAAARQDNPEVQEARRRGVPVILRAEMVARLMEGRYSVAVAGTHGKTTTSSLIAFMLQRAGRSPAYLLGGDSIDLGGNATPGTGEHIVVEADEYARAFLEYRPRLAVVTNIEPDHLDYYGSVDALVDAFRQFLTRVPADGAIISCADSPALEALVREGVRAPVERYSVAAAGSAAGRAALDWLAIDEGIGASGGRSFRVLRGGRPYGEFVIRRAGLHMVANATAAIAAGSRLGLSPEEMRGALAEFHGARRRLEQVGEAGGIAVYDDYAHHPTEVRAQLSEARDRFPDRRIVVLFQPHTYSRTTYLLDGFRECFAGADALYVLETYAARETPDAGMSAEALARAIRSPLAHYVVSIGDAVRTLKQDLRPGDVLFTMGAGDVNTAGPALLATLRG
jgi:UDP-N-acetylmuramate--alanine ligase